MDLSGCDCCCSRSILKNVLSFISVQFDKQEIKKCTLSDSSVFCDVSCDAEQNTFHSFFCLIIIMDILFSFLYFCMIYYFPFLFTTSLTLCFSTNKMFIIFHNLIIFQFIIQ